MIGDGRRPRKPRNPQVPSRVIEARSGRMVKRAVLPGLMLAAVVGAGCLVEVKEVAGGQVLVWLR